MGAVEKIGENKGTEEGKERDKAELELSGRAGWPKVGAIAARLCEIDTVTQQRFSSDERTRDHLCEVSQRQIIHICIYYKDSG